VNLIRLSYSCTLRASMLGLAVWRNGVARHKAIPHASEQEARTENAHPALGSAINARVELRLHARERRPRERERARESVSINDVWFGLVDAAFLRTCARPQIPAAATIPPEVRLQVRHDAGCSLPLSSEDGAGPAAGGIACVGERERLEVAEGDLKCGWLLRRAGSPRRSWSEGPQRGTRTRGTHT